MPCVVRRGRIVLGALAATALFATTAPPAAAAETVLSFDELADGTEIRDQYAARGIRFGLKPSVPGATSGVAPTARSTASARSAPIAADTSACEPRTFSCRNHTDAIITSSATRIAMYLGATGSAKTSRDVVVEGLDDSGTVIAAETVSVPSPSAVATAVELRAPDGQLFRGLTVRLAQESTEPAQIAIDDLSFGVPEATTQPPPTAPPAGPLADLAVGLSAEQAEVPVGHRATYYVRLANLGPDTAENPGVSLELGAAHAFYSADAQCVFVSPKTVRCTLATLASGSVATFKVVAQLLSFGAVRSTARAGSATPDPDPANNEASAIVSGTSAPQAGQTVNTEVTSGVVRIRTPRGFETLEGTRQVKVGSVIDATHGVVAIAGERRRDGRFQVAEFSRGIFRVTQSARTGVIGLRLMGKLDGCSAKKAVASEHRRRGRRLWGRGSGRYRTRGRRSAATVRGTTWIVEDRCDGSTRTIVKDGTVRVRDFTRKKTVTVTAGKRYVAKPSKRRVG